LIERIFNGRNGIDIISLCALMLALLFMPYKWTWLLAVALIGYALFRCFSKNIYKRRQEVWKFQNGLMRFAQFFARNTAGMRNFFKYISLKWKNRKTTVYFKCPKCRKILSLPRHKGKLAVTCTVCGHEFIKKT